MIYSGSVNTLIQTVSWHFHSEIKIWAFLWNQCIQQKAKRRKGGLQYNLWQDYSAHLNMHFLFCHDCEKWVLKSWNLFSSSSNFIFMLYFPPGLQNPVDTLYHLQPLMFLGLFPLFQYNEGEYSHPHSPLVIALNSVALINGISSFFNKKHLYRLRMGVKNCFQTVWSIGIICLWVYQFLLSMHIFLTLVHCETVMLNLFVYTATRSHGREEDTVQSLYVKSSHFY